MSIRNNVGKILSVCAVVLLFCSGCAGIGEEKPPGTKERAFWAWFQQNEPRLFAAKFENDTQTFSDFDKHLMSIHPELVFEFGPVIEGKRDLVISANGLEAVVPAVESTVSLAPKLPRWRVIAFRPKKRPLLPTQYGQATLNPNEVFFALKPDGSRASLTLYVKDDSDDMKSAALISLDQTIGEYDSITRLSGIEIEPLTDAVKTHAKPLPELPEELDRVALPSHRPTVTQRVPSSRNKDQMPSH